MSTSNGTNGHHGSPPSIFAAERLFDSDNPRWKGIKREHGQADVDKLRGTIRIRHTLAELGSQRLWELLHSEPRITALGALTGNQAMQQVRAGLKAIYLSGW